MLSSSTNEHQIMIIGHDSHHDEENFHTFEHWMLLNSVKICNRPKKLLLIIYEYSSWISELREHLSEQAQQHSESESETENWKTENAKPTTKLTPCVGYIFGFDGWIRFDNNLN